MIKPIIYISHTAYQKMKLWVEMAKGEISWLGSIVELKEKGNIYGFLVEDIHLLKQVCSLTNTVLDDQSVGAFLTEMVMQGQDVSNIRGWLHSHAQMKTFWSGTDETCIQNLANSNYLISVVTNKEGDILARVDIFKPFHVTLNDLKVDIYYPEDPQLIEFCKVEFATKVKEDFIPPSLLEPMPFPGRGPVDQQIEELEDQLNAGKISLDEYHQRYAELESIYDFEMFD